MRKDVRGYITRIFVVGVGEKNRTSIWRANPHRWQYRRKKWCDSCSVEPHRNTACLTALPFSQCRCYTSPWLWTLLISRCMAVIKIPPSILFNEVEEAIVSCRVIYRGDFLSQKVRHRSFWIHELTWSVQAHLSPELQKIMAQSSYCLFWRSGKEKSMWKYETPTQHGQGYCPSPSGISNTLPWLLRFQVPFFSRNRGQSENHMKKFRWDLLQGSIFHIRNRTSQQRHALEAKLLRWSNTYQWAGSQNYVSEQACEVPWG